MPLIVSKISALHAVVGLTGAIAAQGFDPEDD